MLFVRIACGVLIVVSSPGVAAAQALTGRVTGEVVEARTGAPLAAVLVQIQSTHQRAFSDAEGKFEIADVPAGSQTLVISVIGFGLVRRDLTIAAGGTSELRIPVAGGASTYVEEVTVAASPYREVEPAVPSQTVLGSRDLLALRGVLADDPFRAVQTLPGVTSSDDFKGEFAIRGLGPEHIGISVDGVDSPFLFHTVRAVNDTGSLALINSDVLDQAVLLAGPHPQKRGAHLGAQLEFVTRDGTRSGFAARTLLSGSAATGVFEGPVGSNTRGSWLVAIRKSYIDWLIKRIDPELDGSFGFTDAQGAIVYDLTPRQQLKLSFIGGRSILHDRDETPSLNSLESGRSRTAIANARWRFTLSPKAVISQQLYFVRSTYTNNVIDGRVREEGSDRDITWRGSLEWRPAAAHAFDAGGQAQSLRARRIDRRFTSPTAFVSQVDATVNTADQAAYLAYRWTPSAAFVVAPGARVEHFKLLHATKTSPWLSADWQITPEMRVRGGAAVQYQAATIDEALLVRAGDGLVPERATSIELGVERRFRSTWRASLTAYERSDNHRLRVKNAEFRLVNNGLARPGTAYIDNVLTGNAHGVELTFERRSVNGWSGWLSYAYGKSTLTDTSGTIDGRSQSGGVASAPTPRETYPADYDQRHTVNVYAAYRWSGRTSVSARFRYGSNFPITAYVLPREDYWVLATERNRARLPGYARLDLRADRTFTYRKRRLTLFMEVINVLNHDNYRAESGSVNLAQRAVFDITGRMFPVLPSAGILIEF
ncbi:MAG TPA: TonB-dependent receptor [Vicinamibacterales bacterium]|nr:TonB-dependent receptor [Vicinamibacterales bacterium]